jgi:transient receptor potential cation channel subfamily M protein 3
MNSSNLTTASSSEPILVVRELDVSVKKVVRLIYCVNTIYWTAKLMEFLVINKYTGPLIIIASRMFIDLFNFIVLIIIVLLSFGLSRQAIKFPNENFNWGLVKAIFLEPYFMLYGEVYAGTIDAPCEYFHNGTMMEPEAPQCQAGHWITPITMTAFMIISVLLFLTILIASFNSTFMRISKQSSLFWRCQRYHFVTSYELKPLLAPPLVILSLIYMISKYAWRACQGKKIKFDRKLKSFLSEDMIERLNDFEENCFYTYRCELEELTCDQLEEKVKHTRNKVESISARIDDIFFKESMTKLSLYKVELRLQKLEEYNFETMNALNNLNSLLRANLNQGNSLKTKKSLEQDKSTRTMAMRHRYNTSGDANSYYSSIANHTQLHLQRQLSRTSMRGINRSNSITNDLLEQQKSLNLSNSQVNVVEAKKTE